MANSTVAALSAASALAGTELFYSDQAGNVKVTATQLKTFASASPTLVTPVLGVASATSINKVAITAPATSATLTIPDGLTLNAGPGGTLGTAAFKNTGASGDAVPLLNVANTWSGAQNIFAQGTTVTSKPFTITQTINDAAVTFNSFLLNVTRTAAASASTLLDVQVAGVSMFNIGNFQGAGSGTIANFAGNVYATTSVQATGSGSFFWGKSNTSSLILGSGADVVLARDAANSPGFRNGTASQSVNVYDTWVSATDYHRLATKTARATLSGVTGASVTATGLIPDGAVIKGVTSKVTTGLGTGSGTTGYQIGTVADPDRWGTVTATASGTTTDNRDWTSGTIECFTAATDVIVTANGGDFDGTGVIYLSVQYDIGQAD